MTQQTNKLTNIRQLGAWFLLIKNYIKHRIESIYSHVFVLSTIHISFWQFDVIFSQNS